MQLPLPLLRQRAAVSVVPLRSGASTLALHLVRNSRARRYVLRVSDAGEVVVTMPRWGSIGQAREFAEQHLAWIARERLRRAAESTARIWSAGSDIWLRGERCAIAFENGVVRAGDIAARAKDETDIKPALRRALREQAKRELPPRLLQLAAEAGLRVQKITVRDQRSRWGSCSTRGSIALNWRLLLMPPSVRDYVLWHELMHLKRADHSPKFWKLVEEVCPDYRTSKSWLSKYGKDLA